MRPSNMAILAVAIVPMLSGCQSIFGNWRGSQLELRVAKAQDPAEFAAAQIALGHEALDNRHYGQAIIAFRNARFAPEHTAAADNGLAVAYAQIGRPDLAERYFKQAIAEAPGEHRYQANLTHFYESVPAAAVRPARESALADRPLPQQYALVLPGNAARAAIRVEAPKQRMLRLSANEVRITSALPAADPRRPAAVRHAAVAKPVRRVNPNYPIRFMLGGGISPIVIGHSASAAPIRIGVSPAN